MNDFKDFVDEHAPNMRRNFWVRIVVCLVVLGFGVWAQAWLFLYCCCFCDDLLPV